MEEFIKQPYEAFAITGDFSANMAETETILTATAVAVDKNGNDVSDTVLDDTTVDIGAQSFSILVQAGLVYESPYIISLRCVTDSDHQWELDVRMRIKDNI
jgi:hypothetical protein